MRPLSADGLPFIGKIPGYDQLVLCTGHGPSGLQLGPYSGLVASRLLTGESVSSDLSAFAVDRDATANVYAGH